MPAYHIDSTLTDRFTSNIDVAVAMAVGQGWEVRDEWTVSDVRYVRLTKIIESNNVTDLLEHMFNNALLALEEMGLSRDSELPPVTVSIAIRDTQFALDESLPYRYTRPVPRKARK